MRALLLALRFALPYGLVIAAGTALTLALREAAAGGRGLALAAVFGGGAMLGAFLGHLLAGALTRRRPWSARFAAHLAALITGTAGGIALITFLADLPGLLDDPGPLLSRAFVEQMGYLLAGSAYALVAVGLPLLLPWGLVPLLGGAFLAARRPEG